MSNPWTQPDTDDTGNSYNTFEPQNTANEYAGFWLRFVALIADSIIIGLFQSFVIMPILAILGYQITFDPTYLETGGNIEQQMPELINYFILLNGISFVLSWVYYAYMESSETQATLGKLMLGIKVTDTSGNRIDFSKATIRYFSKILSGLTLGIGYLMAGFTEKKQTLHDMIAGTLVVKKENNPKSFDFV